MVGFHNTSKPSPYSPETLCFEHTELKTVSMVKRYFQYFQRKLSLLGLQVVDLCELVYKDETVRQKFESDNGNTSLHHSLDRFLMGVLKGFLQNIDEGFADIIDELEDCCSEDHYVQSILKRVIYEFQQNSFSKRQELAKEFDDENEEIGKPSYEWFDSFFGDVTTLLKNPISRSAYHSQGARSTPNPAWNTSETPQFYPVMSQVYPEWQGQQQVWNLRPQEENHHESVDKTSRASSLEFNWDKKMKDWGSGDSQPDLKGDIDTSPVLPVDPTYPLDSAKSSTLSKSEQPGDREKSRTPLIKLGSSLSTPFVEFEDLFEREVYNIDQTPVYCVCQDESNSILVATTTQKLYKYHTDQRRLETVFDGSPHSQLEAQCIFDIKRDYEGRIAFADTDNIYLMADSSDESRLINLGSYSTCKIATQSR